MGLVNHIYKVHKKCLADQLCNVFKKCHQARSLAANSKRVRDKIGQKILFSYFWGWLGPKHHQKKNSEQSYKKKDIRCRNIIRFAL